ncbi:hypothetical protein F0562_001501 [Nyssa sinensis]|uniref:Uncharacterized protein n=1 Tax=Nyssa sinensis TaxID=561372 RepID=A0A5J5C7D6_9ASTE|nr:hypothetical protein F0562_001501 [Nyssa sinensis]
MEVGTAPNGVLSFVCHRGCRRRSGDGFWIPWIAIGLCVADWRDAKRQTGWDGSVGELSTLAVELDFEAGVPTAESVRRNEIDQVGSSDPAVLEMTVGIDLGVLKANSSVVVDLIANYGRIQVIAVKK